MQGIWIVKSCWGIFLPASVAAAAKPAAVYGSAPGGAALIMYGFGTKAAGAKPAENTPVTVTKSWISPKKHHTKYSIYAF